MKKSAIWFQYEEEYNKLTINGTQLYCAPYTLSTEDEDAPYDQIIARIETSLEKKNLSYVSTFGNLKIVVYKRKV